MALMNRNLESQLETVFLVPAFDLTYLSSSLVREVALRRRRLAARTPGGAGGARPEIRAVS